MAVSKTVAAIEAVLARAEGAQRTERYCFNCEFYADGMQTCQRYAPRPGQFVRDDDYTAWPQVQRDDFCGEFQPADSEPDGGWWVADDVRTLRD